MIRTRRLRTMLLVVVVMVAGTACGDDSAVSPGGRSLQNMSEYQAGLLEDGELTFAEYEQAMFAMVQCLRDAGIEAEDPVLEEAGFSFVTRDPEPEDTEEFQESFASCYEEHISVIELEWADLNAPSVEEEQAFYQSVADCLTSRDIRVDSIDPAELDRVIEAYPVEYDECFEEAIETTEQSGED